MFSLVLVIFRLCFGFCLVLFWFLFWFLFGSVSVIEMAVSVKEKATNPLELVA